MRRQGHECVALKRRLGVNRILGVILAALLGFATSNGRAAESFATDSVQLVHRADSVQLRLRFWFPDRQQVGRKDVLLAIPKLVNGNDSLELPSVGLYGRIPWLYGVRRGEWMLQGSQDVMLRAKEVRRDVPLSYIRTVRYQPWMEGACVKVELVRVTCCGDLTNLADWLVLNRQETVIPTETIYHTRRQTASGQAHVDFIVNRIELRPDYHDNYLELDKISRLIDSIQALPRTHIDSIALHGYASPEGPYDNNVYLAKNRVRALAMYLAEHHRLDSAIISQQYTPEDWAGLRRFVDESQLPHRREILAHIDDTVALRRDPDRHLAVVKVRYPQDYAVILADYMPYLRHTEYTILYTTTSQTAEVKPEVRKAELPEDPHFLTDRPHAQFTPLRPLFAVKTNLLYDAALWPNVEVEVPFGPDARWSVMAEWGSPWYVWHHNSRAYQILNVGAELRRWLGKCPACRPVLSGAFVGLYGYGGKYDLEWNSIGNQAEYANFGVSAGYSWPISRCLNIEVGGSVGVVFGKRRHYHGEFDDTHLIWKRFGSVFYAGPTRLSVTLVWLIPRKWFKHEELKN